MPLWSVGDINAPYRRAPLSQGQAEPAPPYVQIRRPNGMAAYRSPFSQRRHDDMSTRAASRVRDVLRARQMPDAVRMEIAYLALVVGRRALVVEIRPVVDEGA